MGSATMLLAKLAGCSVIATTRYPQKAVVLKQLGADLVVDTGSADALQKIRDFTKGEGVDGAVEYTGATELMRLAIDAMRLGGTFCPVAGEMKELPLRVVDMVGKELNVHGVRGATLNDQRIVTELLEQGRIAMPIQRSCRSLRSARPIACWKADAIWSGASCCTRGTSNQLFFRRHAIHDEFGALVHLDVPIRSLLFAGAHFLRLLGRHHFLRCARLHGLREGGPAKQACCHRR